MYKVIKNIRELVEIMDTQYHGKIAYEFLRDGQTVQMTYSEVVQKAKAVSSFLQENKYRRAVIGILGSTSCSWVCTYLGVLLSDNIVVPMDNQLILEDYVTIINRVQVQIIFMEKKFKHLISDLMENCPSLEKVIVFEEEFCSINDISYDTVLPINPNDLAQFMFTSGTTGDSKIVMLSYQNIMTTVNAETRHYKANEVLLSVLPIFHCYEIFIGQLGILKIGAKICINDKLENLLTNMQRFKPNGIYTVPLIAENLLRNAKKVIAELGVEAPNESMSIDERRIYYSKVNDKAFGGNLRVVCCGGAKISTDFIREFEKLGIHFITGYGMTETTGTLTSNRVNKVKHGSVGYSVNKKISIRIDDGEVVVNSPGVMLGYYNCEQANKEIFTEDHWLKTGDIGYLDEDGYLYITGRKKNLIILENGKNVSPEELENYLLNIPNVLNAMVYESKKKIAGVIYAKTGFEEIQAQVRLLNERLPMYKRIVEISFLDEEFPLTSSKKIKRNEILSMLEEQKKKEKFAEPETENEREVAAAVKKILAINEAISMNDDYFSLGGDSYNALELAVYLKIEVQMIYDYPKLRELANQIGKQRADTEESADQSDYSVNQLISYESHKEIEDMGNHVFLTGASGFLGAHILHELLAMPEIHVTCLVRRKERLTQTYQFYFNELLPDSVDVRIGDLTAEFFGLSKEEYYKLAQETDICFHTAANVHHLGKYEEFQAVNVEGTRNVLDFCKEGNVILQHTSTYSVSGIGVVTMEENQKSEQKLFDENILYIGQNYKENVYVHSKYEAEKLVLEARKEGVNTNIFRIGSLAWRKSDRRFQKNGDDNGLVNKLFGWNEVGCYVKKFADYWVDFTPVDECAKALVLLAFKKSVNNIYHLFNPKVLNVKDLEKVFDKKYEAVSEEEFYNRIKDQMDNKYVANYAFYHSLALKSEHIPMSNEYTRNSLKELGFEWSEIDKEYVVEGLKKVK